MPLHQRVNIDEQTQILIWYIEEPLEELKKDLFLAKSDEIRFQKRKILSHQKEFWPPEDSFWRRVFLHTV